MRYGKAEKREATGSDGSLYTIFLNPETDRYDVYQTRAEEKLLLAEGVYYFNRKQSTRGQSACAIANTAADEALRFGPAHQRP